MEVGDNEADVELGFQNSNALEYVGGEKHLATQAFFQQAAHDGGVHRLVFNVENFHTHSFGALKENFIVSGGTFSDWNSGLMAETRVDLRGEINGR